MGKRRGIIGAVNIEEEDMRQFWIYLAGVLFFLCPHEAEAAELTAIFPYSLTADKGGKAPSGSTQLLYWNIEQINGPAGAVEVAVTLPEGFRVFPGQGWEMDENGRTAKAERMLPEGYGNVFDALPVEIFPDTIPGNYHFSVSMRSGGEEEAVDLPFQVTSGEAAGKAEREKSLGWYIQNVTVPVDENGNKDDRQAQNTIFIQDTTLEMIRSRLTGKGGADWNALRNTPVTYVLLELRNPKKDVRNLHFKAELRDRRTRAVVSGLLQPGEGGAAASESGAAEAVIGLTGSTVQTAVLPLFCDPAVLEEGDYFLRIVIGDRDTACTTETPVTVAKKKQMGLAVLGFSLCCFLAVLFSLRRLKRCIRRIGAGGDISVALFAALAFGGVVVPVTLFGDFLHVILGPFAGLATGLLSGVLQYLLLMALLMLIRRPGTASLFFVMKWLLAGLLFGRFTPVAVLNYAVYIAIVETALYLSGFYRKNEITGAYKAFLCVLMGIADMGITFINLEQIMFFYRLYYADWFIGLYAVVNGLIYSTAGSWIGIRIGERLKQVMGQ